MIVFCPDNARPGGPVPTRSPIRGTTLVEVLVVLVIVSILATTALPFAQTSLQRRHEITLQDTLREVRTALDNFNDDWRAERFAGGQRGISDNGYPTTLDVLVDGLTIVDADGKRRHRRYLRRLPDNPFARGGSEPWLLLGYDQIGTPSSWDRRDVYDLRARTDRKALNGSPISTW